MKIITENKLVLLEPGEFGIRKPGKLDKVFKLHNLIENKRFIELVLLPNPNYLAYTLSIIIGVVMISSLLSMEIIRTIIQTY